MEQILKFIGKIISPLKSIEDCPLQENENAPEAELAIFPEFMEGIKDIAVNSEILLLTWLHEADRTVIKCNRRYDTGSAIVGVFSTRSPNRPNPIGMHTVRVVSISENGLIKVSGLEALNNTPIIDIKPTRNS